MIYFQKAIYLKESIVYNKFLNWIYVQKYSSAEHFQDTTNL